MRNPPVAVLILNYNGRELLDRCLSSLTSTSYPDIQTWVVDNCSTDDSVSYVRNHFPSVKIIQLEGNYGFSRAYNMAVARVASDYLLFLNNDVEIKDPRWLDEMMQAMLGDSETGAIGPKVLLGDTPELLDNIGGTLYSLQGPARIGFQERDLHQYDNPPARIFYVSGAALLIQTRVFRIVGGFDPYMFAYAEDLDLCWRLQIMGYSVRYCPNSVIYHFPSSSWKKKRAYSLYLLWKHTLRTSLKNYSTFNVITKIPPFMLTNLLLAFGGAVLSGNPRDTAFALVRSWFANLKDFRSVVSQRVFVQMRRRVGDDVVLKPIDGRTIESFDRLRFKMDLLLGTRRE